MKMRNITMCTLDIGLIIMCGTASSVLAGKETMTESNAVPPYMIVMSDTHVSCPEGRWAKATPHFKAFLSSLQADPPEILFINGDIVDNMVIENGKPVMGTVQHWEQDVATYHAAIAPYKQIAFRGSLGPNHDFYEVGNIPEALAGEKLCPQRGSFAWQGFDFVWLSSKIHAFSNEPSKREESFTPDDLQWLDRELAGKQRVVLFFHVPLRTAETAKRGPWPGNRNITTPPEDKIYSLIDRHLDKIELIFHGHIHQAMETDYKGIPIRLTPFWGQGHYSKVSVDGDVLRVEQHTFRRSPLCLVCLGVSP